MANPSILQDHSELSPEARELVSTIIDAAVALARLESIRTRVRIPSGSVLATFPAAIAAAACLMISR